jgi:L-aminopeptidase/D-esterase-like protein
VTDSTEARRPVEGARVGQAEDGGGTSGVTAVLFDQPTPVVVEVRGGASATYDTASLSLDATFGRRWGLFFSGGSVHGLDAAAGIRDRILETGGGAAVFRNPHRIAPISGAALFDLPSTVGMLPDYRALGYQAAHGADRAVVAVGRVGAGVGATVGKYRGRSSAMRGGVGWSSRRFGRGRVGVLVAVNSVGAVRDPARGAWVAGARGPRGRIIPPVPGTDRTSGTAGTTLAIILTDLEVARPALHRAAEVTNAALGGVVVPFQTATDGDVLFAASTGVKGPPASEQRPGEIADALGTAAAVCAVGAVLTAVRAANGTR